MGFHVFRKILAALVFTVMAIGLCPATALASEQADGGGGVQALQAQGGGGQPTTKEEAA